MTNYIWQSYKKFFRKSSILQFILMFNININIFKVLFVYIKNSYYICGMRKLLECKCIIVFNKKDNIEEEKLRELGIPIEGNNSLEEKIVKYSFDASEVVEVRETFVEYQKEWYPAVAVTYKVAGSRVMETPSLLISYKEFKKKLDEYNKEDS